MNNDVFDAAFRYLTRHDVEGGEVNDPLDNGGHTKFGLTAGFLADIGLTIADIRTINDARPIYRDHFFVGGQCHKMDWAPGFVHFDAMVQHHPISANKILQRALGVSADGHIGAKTLHAANQMHNRYEFWLAYMDRRLDFYHDEISEESNPDRFIKGWNKRLIKLTGALYQYGIYRESGVRFELGREHQKTSV